MIAPRRFKLVRHQDETGISGEGTVAYGCEFPTGTVALNWCAPGRPRSVVIWSCMDDAMEVHGHGGLTEAVWLD